MAYLEQRLDSMESNLASMLDTIKEMSQRIADLTIAALSPEKAPTVNTEEEELDIEGAALCLGLSKSRVRVLCQQREIPHYRDKSGRRLRFVKAELLSWKNNRRGRKVECFENVRDDIRRYYQNTH